MGRLLFAASLLKHFQAVYSPCVFVRLGTENFLLQLYPWGRCRDGFGRRGVCGGGTVTRRVYGIQMVILDLLKPPESLKERAVCSFHDRCAA